MQGTEIVKGVLNMKKLFAVVAVLCCMLMFCGSAFAASDRVVIYTAAEDERIAYLQEELDKQFPNVEIVFQSLGTGQLLSKLQAEGTDTDCDIFYDLEVVNAEIIRILICLWIFRILISPFMILPLQDTLTGTINTL